MGEPTISMLFPVAFTVFLVVSWHRTRTEHDLTQLFLEYRNPRIAASVAFKMHQLVLHVCLVCVGYVAKGDLTVNTLRMTEVMNPAVQLVYWCHMCFQLQNVWYQPGKIHWVLGLHHAVTMFLIGTSYVYGATEYGILVMFWHDLSDIPIYVIRSLRLWEDLEDDKDRRELKVSTWNFVLCLAMYPALLYSWFRYRIWDLGTMIWFAYSTESVRYLDSTAFVWSAITALSALWLMNAFWLEIMLRKVVLTCVAKLQSDQSIDDDGQDVMDSAPFPQTAE